MAEPQWEDVEVPRGAFIGWGDETGQHVTGKVVDYSPDGGTDFYQDPCPSLAVELTQPAASFDKAGNRTDHEPGELVQLNAGQVSLKRALRAADPAPGDLIKIVFDNMVPLKGGRTVKEFSLKIARGSGRAAAPKSKLKSVSDPWASDAPPF